MRTQVWLEAAHATLCGLSQNGPQVLYVLSYANARMYIHWEQFNTPLCGTAAGRAAPQSRSLASGVPDPLDRPERHAEAGFGSLKARKKEMGGTLINGALTRLLSETLGQWPDTPGAKDSF